MQDAAVADIRMHFVEAGSGATLLLVHGFPLDHTMWDPIVERLRGECRLIVPDLRGYGRSTLGDVDPEAGVSMERYADDLAGLLDAIGAEGPIVYAGFSMGGYIGWQFVRRHGDRLAALAACDTRAATDTDEARGMRLRMARHVAEWGAERVAEAMLPKLFAASSVEQGLEVVARTAEVIGATDPSAIAAAQRGMAARPDATGMLPTLDLPAALVVGEEDRISTPAEMRSMADAMPNAKLTVVPSAGHMAPVENPEPVAEALRGLL